MDVMSKPPLTLSVLINRRVVDKSEWRPCKGHRPPASPKPNLWKLTEHLFSNHSWRRPLSNGQLGLFKTQLTVSVRSEVTGTPHGVKLKVAVLSIQSWKFMYTTCFVQEAIAYECTHVWASEKKAVFVKLAQYWKGEVISHLTSLLRTHLN
jgi:hypothetical protein